MRTNLCINSISIRCIYKDTKEELIANSDALSFNQVINIKNRVKCMMCGLIKQLQNFIIISSIYTERF